MHIKYKMLWFSVDTHHRQRYFFNCGCKQIVMEWFVRPRPSGAERQPRVTAPSNFFPVFAN